MDYKKKKIEIIEKLEIKCEGKCGKNVDWIVRDEEAENPQVALAIQCGYCGKLNINRPYSISEN